MQYGQDFDRFLKATRALQECDDEQLQRFSECAYMLAWMADQEDAAQRNSFLLSHAEAYQGLREELLASVAKRTYATLDECLALAMMEYVDGAVACELGKLKSWQADSQDVPEEVARLGAWLGDKAFAAWIAEGIDALARYQPIETLPPKYTRLIAAAEEALAIEARRAVHR